MKLAHSAPGVQPFGGGCDRKESASNESSRHPPLGIRREYRTRDDPADKPGTRPYQEGPPIILGLMVAPHRDRANVYGFLLHLVNRWIFSLFYVAFFTSLRRTTWWLGAIIGLFRGLLVLAVLTPIP